EFLASYRAAIAESLRSGMIGEIEPSKASGPIGDLLGETALGKQAELLDHHTERLPHGGRKILRSDDKHPEVSQKKYHEVQFAVEQYGKRAGKSDAFRVLDVAGRIMGIGGLGLRRYTVLIAGGGTDDTNRLLDLKEVSPSSVLSCATTPQPENGGNE